MSMFDRLSPELAELGDALHSAVTADLARTQSAAGAGLAVGDARPRSRSRLRAVARSATRTRRRIAVTVAVLVVAVPGAALAANALLSPSQVAGGLAQGTLALLGTHPSCTTVQAGVEYHCVLQSAPSNQGGPAAEPVAEHGRAVGRIRQARQRRLPRPEPGRHRLGVLPRPGGGHAEDHRPGVPWGVLAEPGRRVARAGGSAGAVRGGASALSRRGTGRRVGAQPARCGAAAVTPTASRIASAISGSDSSSGEPGASRAPAASSPG
jgi:hypothetical protein